MRYWITDNQSTDSTGGSIVSECSGNMVLNGDKTVSFNPLPPFIQANNAGTDLTPRSVASDLGLHCLPMFKFRFYRYFFTRHFDVTETKIARL